jgi:hypothetical protein
MEQSAVRKVHLSYFGAAVPEYYGIDYSPLPSFPILRKTQQDEIRRGDIVAISATNLQKIYVGRGPQGSPAAQFGAFVDFLRTQQPVAQLGYTIFVYRMGATL